MPFMRIYEYPGKTDPFKHIYFKRDRGAGKYDDGEEGSRNDEEDGKLDESLYRTRRLVRDYILCNSFTLFCTFTFSADRVDRYNYRDCKTHLTRFFDKYKQRQSPDFRYLAIPEKHTDNAFHFHGVVRGIRPEDFYTPELIDKRMEDGSLQQVPNTPGYVRWKQYEEKCGYFSCSVIRNRERCAQYVSKYITKDLQGLAKGSRVLLASKGLQKPQLVFDMDDVPLTFQPEYQDEFCMMAYRSQADTLGTFLPEWYGEVCSDLQDEYDTNEDGLSADEFTAEQLRMVV